MKKVCTKTLILVLNFLFPIVIIHPVKYRSIPKLNITQGLVILHVGLSKTVSGQLRKNEITSP